jgi:transposase
MISKPSAPLRLHHLPLLMDVIRRMRLLNVIGSVVRDDSRSKVSTGDCLSVMLCAIFSGAHDLYGVRERLGRYDMATIMQNPKFSIEDFPEERLAKAMDDIWSTGPEKLMFAIASQVIAAFRLDTSYFHFDTTSLTCYGAYENEDKELSGDGELPPWMTYGHSKDRRPDLKQIMYGMMMSGDGGVPVFGEVLDGNASDTAATADFFRRIRHLVEDPRKVVCVADCKGWSGSVVSLIQANRMRLLSRLPRNHGIHSEILAQAWKPTGKITTGQQRKKNTPPDTYDFMGMDVTATFTVVHPEADGKPKRTEVVQAPARAVRVFSSGLLRTKVATLKRIRERDMRAATVFMRDAQKRAFACEEDAQRAAKRDVEAQRRATLDLEATISHQTGTYARGRGRPPKRPEPGIAGPHWRIRYTVVPVADAVATKRLHAAATFVVIRTKTPGWEITDADMIRRYKGQYLNEHGFTWLKSGAALNPIYLKTPHRIASLGFTYCIGLMIWALIQRSVRAHLQEHGHKLPYHRGRRGSNITTRFIFELFQNVQSQTQVMPDGTTQYYIHGMNDETTRACRALGTRLSVFKPVSDVA